MYMSKIFNTDIQIGKAAEGELVCWIQNYFNSNNPNKNILSYQYDSDFEANERGLKGSERDKVLKKYDLKFRLYKEKVDYLNKIKDITFEIKCDKYNNTGNVCIEYTYRGNPSGIFSSNSDFFINWMPRFSTNNLYIVKLDKFKEMLLNNFMDKLRPTGDTIRDIKGGSKMAMSFIISKEDFEDKFKECGGRIEYADGSYIVNKFNLSTFGEKDNSGKVIYTCSEMKNYNDDNII